ncbi:MFS transporter, partial [Cutibacterium acnes]
ATAIPTICCLGAALLMLGYPLTRDKVVANADKLARRHEAQAEQIF